jgi:hypothetical protein
MRHWLWLQHAGDLDKMRACTMMIAAQQRHGTPMHKPSQHGHWQWIRSEAYGYEGFWSNVLGKPKDFLPLSGSKFDYNWLGAGFLRQVPAFSSPSDDGWLKFVEEVARWEMEMDTAQTSSFDDATPGDRFPGMSNPKCKMPMYRRAALCNLLPRYSLFAGLSFPVVPGVSWVDAGSVINAAVDQTFGCEVFVRASTAPFADSVPASAVTGSYKFSHVGVTRAIMDDCKVPWASHEALSFHMPENMVLDPQSRLSGKLDKEVRRPVPRLFQFAPTPDQADTTWEFEGNIKFKFNVSANGLNGGDMDDTDPQAAFTCPGEVGELPLKVTGEFGARSMLPKEKAFFDYWQQDTGQGYQHIDDNFEFQQYAYYHCDMSPLDDTHPPPWALSGGTLPDPTQTYETPNCATNGDSTCTTRKTSWAMVLNEFYQMYIPS